MNGMLRTLVVFLNAPVFVFSSAAASLEAEAEEDAGLSFHSSNDGSSYHHALNVLFGGGPG
jgi:hypothetical protein